MKETGWQKFKKHCNKGGLPYALYRGIKYFFWRLNCLIKGIDWRQFSR